MVPQNFKDVQKNHIIPPSGGRIQVLYVDMDEALDWEAAVTEVQISDGKLLNVGDQYPSRSLQGVQKVILAKFDDITPRKDVIAWGESQQLCTASPRVVFAIGRRYPKLYTDIGIRTAASEPLRGSVESLHRCISGGKPFLCSVEWIEDRDTMAMLLPENEHGRSPIDEWVAFVPAASPILGGAMNCGSDLKLTFQKVARKLRGGKRITEKDRTTVQQWFAHIEECPTCKAEEEKYYDEDAFSKFLDQVFGVRLDEISGTEQLKASPESALDDESL